MAIQHFNGWVASIASGSPLFSAPPPGFRGWLTAAVLGGTAYARVSTGTVDIIDPSSGETCGSLMVPGSFAPNSDHGLPKKRALLFNQTVDEFFAGNPPKVP